MEEKKVYKYSKEKIKEYNQSFKTRHQNEKIKCDVCYLEYPKLSSSYHPRSKEHLTALRVLDNLRVNHEKGEA